MDDEALLQAFESCALPGADFGHKEHVRVAWLCVTREPTFEAAALRFCTNLRRFAHALGKGDRYHETITWAFLAIVNERRHVNGAPDFDAFAAKNADLFAPDLAALHALYDRETLRSDMARRVFVLPGSSPRSRPALPVSSPADADAPRPPAHR
jgi:hypothetical protein